MSGGHFNYDQYKIEQIARDVEQLIIDNDSKELNEYGDEKGRAYSKETITEFKAAFNILQLAAIYAQRIDWLISGDDGENTFRERLERELKQLKERNT